MKLFRTKQGIVIEDGNLYYPLPETGWDDLFNRPSLEGSLTSMTRRLEPITGFSLVDEVLAPIGEQEVWAAGVTYYRSREARIEESRDAGGGDFYDRVYAAARPELFFKATPHRVSGAGQDVRIRRDAAWNVPEPELALAVNSSGRIIGFTIGNDMSSRDIEGENPLYLPQAKVYDGCCGLGPGVLISSLMPAEDTEIRLEIERDGAVAFLGSTYLRELKRRPEELVEYLFRDNSFPRGCFLLTGTGIVPPDEFTLMANDEIRITIDPIGTLVNRVAAL
ncbi:MAG: fumarylacetoacetate hydrolase family protein [Acidobacteria bacterium]|nr:fumarylacetoacetate hydrolase family protein [Acidobacteriota bacterium]